MRSAPNRWGSAVDDSRPRERVWRLCWAGAGWSSLRMLGHAGQNEPMWASVGLGGSHVFRFGGAVRRFKPN